jgi:hypothetical protein
MAENGSKVGIDGDDRFSFLLLILFFACSLFLFVVAEKVVACLHHSQRESEDEALPSDGRSERERDMLAASDRCSCKCETVTVS